MENHNKSIINYPYSSRDVFYKKLAENPSLMWPVGNDWSYKNRNKYCLFYVEYMELFNLIVLFIHRLILVTLLI
jgi:hypothetical protein